eukprot:scaffold32546_cov32-Prasinocladus_malaysianus.AAC.2
MAGGAEAFDFRAFESLAARKNRRNSAENISSPRHSNLVEVCGDLFMEGDRGRSTWMPSVGSLSKALEERVSLKHRPIRRERNHRRQLDSYIEITADSTKISSGEAKATVTA